MIAEAEAKDEGGQAAASQCIGRLRQGQRGDQCHKKGVQRINFNQDRLRPEGELKGQGQPAQRGRGAHAWLPRPQGLHQPGDQGGGDRRAESREQGHAACQFADW